MKSWSFQHSFLWSFCSPSPAVILKNTQNIFKQNIYILVFETIQNISLNFFPLHPLKCLTLATKIVFLSNKTKPCFSQRQNWPAENTIPFGSGCGEGAFSGTLHSLEYMKWKNYLFSAYLSCIFKSGILFLSINW